MRYLLDTHALIWWWTDSPNLSEAARGLIADGANTIYVSAISAYEIALKWRLGKLPQFDDPIGQYGPLMASNGFTCLPLTDGHALAAGTLDIGHRDPFDRLIAAQARADDLIVVTRDAALATLGCRTLWQ